MQDVIKRRLEEIELLSQDLLEVGTTKWEALFNPQKIDLGNISAEAILELEKVLEIKEDRNWYWHSIWSPKRICRSKKNETGIFKLNWKCP